ncbi:hypothetical protein Godav_010067, partial [Gossypium davidsonii]|nr:hypothetical protein [Gossypium davidsonii]
MEKELAKLIFEEEEDEGLQFATEARPQRSIYEMCLVGCCLTTSIVNFLALKNTMTNLWHSLGESRSLTLVQVHDLPQGFFFDCVVQQLGDFVGKFLEHDTKQLNQGFRNIMRIPVEIDIRNPLKRKKKI